MLTIQTQHVLKYKNTNRTSPSMKSTQIEHTNYSRKTKAQAQKYKNPHNKNTTKKSPYAQTKN